MQKYIAVDKHTPFEDAHYQRWQKLWKETADRCLFTGFVAENAKNQASLMLQLIRTKVQAARLPNFIQ